ncbi:MAG: site-specific integrase [Solirubrobacterales bacterium]|nr:MAG: site-specific integrase [Solirubrobacterales bacterium]PZS08062.1 MAG: site-specific integrase [Solirubrobacterales bacterium]
MSSLRGPSRRLRPVRDPVPRLTDAVDAFLAQPDLAASSCRSYTQTLARLRDALGGDRPLDRVGTRELERATLEMWGATAPATWNRHVATLRSFDSFCRRRGWLQEAIAGGLERRREPADRTKAIPYPQLDRLWRRDDVAVREKTLWRLLYETAARAQEVLSVNVEDVDLENKRARVRSKGGDTEWLHLQSGSARLLPRLITGRERGPLFLADRRPAPARIPAASDLCPSTGRGRLSYRRAEELFCAASGGWTLHQLRHSAITHLAEADVGLALLMAKSRHTSLRSLQRYARPGPEAVAKLTAEHDPERRRR